MMMNFLRRYTQALVAQADAEERGSKLSTNQPHKSRANNHASLLLGTVQ